MPRPPIALPVAAALAAALALPTLAQAATVSMSGDPALGNLLTLEAAPGEQNRLTVSVRAGEAILEDGGAPLAAGAGCAQLAPSRVRCAWDGTVDLFVRLGDGSDTAAIETERRAGILSTSVDAGPGDDEVSAGASDDHLTGGGGRDVLLGGGGDDRLSDGDGSAGRFDSDVLDGGEGGDSVTYHGRSESVRIDLARGEGQGHPEELDAIRGIENAQGGAGDDVILGDGRANELTGGGGDDILAARAGDDTVDGGLGLDRQSGGSGDDILYAEERDELGGEAAPRADVVQCGRGRDRIFATDAISLLGRDCEELLAAGFSRFPVNPAVDRRLSRATYRVPCQRIGNDRSSRCSTRVELRDARGRLLGRGGGSVRTRPGRFIRIRYQRFAVPVRLTARARRVLRRQGHVEARATVRSTVDIPGLGRSRGTTRYAFLLRAPR